MKTIDLEQASKRRYHVVVNETGIVDTFNHSLKTLLTRGINGNDYEYIYAIEEIIDSVLDLKIDESMYFQPIRDDNNSKGIIVRIK